VNGLFLGLRSLEFLQEQPLLGPRPAGTRSTPLQSLPAPRRKESTHGAGRPSAFVRPSAPRRPYRAGGSRKDYSKSTFAPGVRLGFAVIVESYFGAGDLRAHRPFHRDPPGAGAHRTKEGRAAPDQAGHRRRIVEDGGGLPAPPQRHQGAGHGWAGCGRDSRPVRANRHCARHDSREGLMASSRRRSPEAVGRPSGANLPRWPCVMTGHRTSAP
jgi:hypothetical protein